MAGESPRGGSRDAAARKTRGWIPRSARAPPGRGLERGRYTGKSRESLSELKKVLLLHPKFSPHGFWNYREVCNLVGAKYPASPLGLITMAALLPSEWEIELVDLNTRELEDRRIDGADLVFLGGMLPQQAEILRLIERVHSRGKKVVVGGPDPTSQPERYRSADYLVLGEAEASLPLFLEDLERGAPSGVYEAEKRPDMAASPVPRFDLLDFSDYIMIGVQFSRGCPFNCEFCDIVELYGRIPRTKSPGQIVEELEALYRLGHRGHVDFVDDNFIGNKKRAVEILRAVLEWSESRGRPFFFSTEASLNLADDDEILSLMEKLDFRYVFVGVESPDQPVLESAGKTSNLRRDMVKDLEKIYRRGIVVNAGFILGFDGEDDGIGARIVDFIRRGRICMAMVGLLYALPNTRLTRRLRREGRLFEDFDVRAQSAAEDVDQTTSGINFRTERPRERILEDYLFILREVYSRRDYFDRCLALARSLRVKPKFRPPLRVLLRYGRGFFLATVKLGFRPSTAYYWWRNLLVVLFTRPSSLETLVNLMAMYLHFGKQAAYLRGIMESKLEGLRAGRFGKADSNRPARPVSSAAE